MEHITTTPKGVEGHGISYSDEAYCSKTLKEFLPRDWKVTFQWVKILFSDVEYNIDKKHKTIEIVYNQNLRIWWSQLLSEVVGKLEKMKVIEKAPSPESA